jgi:hypothetical protein
MDPNQIPASVTTEFFNRPRLEFAYPRISGLADNAIQARINQAIVNLMNRLIGESGYYENPLTDVMGTYAVKTNERGVLSLTLTIYWYAGGAHGMTVIRALTFATDTGQEYQLRDLFKPGSDYVRELSGIVSGQIQARGIELLGPFQSIRPDQDFYIADKCLVIYFQLYEIAAYVFGILYFPISVYQIREIINEDGPLGRMLY